MIASLRPYPAYRDTGVPWLGPVPEHWDIHRLKTLLREVDERSATGTETLLSLRMQLGLVDHHALGGKTIPPPSLVGYKRTRPGEIVMNRMRAAAGLFAVTPVAGIVSPDYAVMRPIRPVSLAYFVYLFRTPGMMSTFRLESRGLGTGESGFLRLYTNRFGTLGVPEPPIGDQMAIVRFLDHVDRRVRRAIRAKQKLIALLNEQKRVTIHRAVTRGLDPTVRLKPSGVEWLGDVPEHWEVWRIGHFAKVGNGSTPSRGNPGYWRGGAYPWLNSASVHRNPVLSADQFVTDLALQECHLPRVRPGSVLVAITGQGRTRGTAAVLAIETTINQHIAYITPRLRVIAPDYLQLVLTGAYRELRAISDDAGSTKGALTCSDVGRFKIPQPPLAEQASIVSAVKDETQALEAAMRRAEREIELFREYWTRLVAEIVVGRLDVTPLAASMDEPEEPHAPQEQGAGDEEDDEAPDDYAALADVDGAEP